MTSSLPTATERPKPDEELARIFKTKEQVRAELGVAPVSTDTIRDPATYEQEKEKIFRKVWLKVALTNELPEVGNYKTKELPVVDASVIIIRGKDNRIRAFHNVCTHRGNKVVPTDGWETFGHADRNVLTCRFHGWGFSTDGELKAVPKMEAFGELDTSCLGLREIACDVWEGFVFINLNPEPTHSLANYLGDFGKLYGGYPYQEATTAYRYTAVLNCNWKVAHYAFSEGYHVETIHAGTLPGFMGVEQIEPKIMGPHASSALYSGKMDVMPSTQAFASRLHRSPVHGPHPEKIPPNINPTNRDDFQFELSNTFPNFLIHLAAGCGYPGMAYFTHQFWPLSHNQTLWEGINYFRPAQNAAETVAQLHVNALHRNGWLEDTATMEDTFVGLASGAIEKIQLMDDEFLIRHATHTLEDYLNG